MHSRAKKRRENSRAPASTTENCSSSKSTSARPLLPLSIASQVPNTIQPAGIEPLPVANLRPRPGNARTHSKKQIRQIADSIRQFGFNNPVLIGEDGEIIAGHGRVEAAKLLGLDCVPTVRLAHLNAAQRRAPTSADGLQTGYVVAMRELPTLGAGRACRGAPPLSPTRHGRHDPKQKNAGF